MTTRSACVRIARTSLIDAEWEWLLRRAETLEVNEAGAEGLESETPQRRTLPPPPFQPELVFACGPASLEPADMSLAVDAAEERGSPAREAATLGRTGRVALGGALGLVAVVLVSVLVIRGLQNVHSGVPVSAALVQGASFPPNIPGTARDVDERDAAQAVESQAFAAPPLPLPGAASVTSLNDEIAEPGGGSRERVRKMTVRQGPRVRTFNGLLARRSRTGSDNPY